MRRLSTCRLRYSLVSPLARCPSRPNCAQRGLLPENTMSESRCLSQVSFGGLSRYQQSADDQEEQSHSSGSNFKSTLYKVFETGATTLASILILGAAGYSYHKYYKHLILEKMEDAFRPGNRILQVANIESGVVQSHYEERWGIRDEQKKVDRVIAGSGKGQYFLIIGEKGTGKTSLVLEAMRKVDGEGVAMFDAHNDFEIFRIRLGKALDYEFHEGYVGGLFSIKGPRDRTAILDIERAFDVLEKAALRRRKRGLTPFVLVINSMHLIREGQAGEDLLAILQHRAERWAESNLVTMVFNSRDYWVYERLRRNAKRMDVIAVSDLPKREAMEALKMYRSRYFGEELPSKILEDVYDLVGGRISFLNQVATSKDMIRSCMEIHEQEKTWFLNTCWILGNDIDIEELTEQKYCLAAVNLARALVDKDSHIEKQYDLSEGYVLPEIPLHDARRIMARGDFIQGCNQDNIFTIDSRAMVRAVSVPMQRVFREICSEPGFEEHREATEKRIDEIESLLRTREISLKDLESKRYRLSIQDSKGQETGSAELAVGSN
ncbi:hypothetical protein BDV25DRAFT_125237 [Aspergillus avenaceus]|uniref:Uncharacterized protein n=1 Tax=Aspergillus avenaceus TaxID=36643 RepID=A0A5N6TT17_ASPAV|nr:hypothetical protein BDV25DRAFT_125237 [Aspergillus avenaceus]